MGRFPYDTTGVKEAGNFPPIPDDEYLFRIVETIVGKTVSGADILVKVTLVVKDGEYAGRKVWHQVCFKPPQEAGAGFAKHWLHAIGEPYEGKISVDPDNWIGKVVRATTKIEEYNNKKNNKVDDVLLPNSYPENLPQPDPDGTAQEPADTMEKVPF